jgi:uncharacterized protein
MPSFHDLVILFTRYPQIGKCKSRLIPALGAKGALKVHKQLVSHILKVLNTFLDSTGNTGLHIFYSGGTLKENRQWLGDTYILKKQQGNNLGERMANALLHGLDNKHNSVLIGSDCPGIQPHIIQDSLEALRQNDLVLGPAHDGGYYLIGVARNIPKETCRQLFEKIPWGTDQVFAQTLRHAETLALNTHILNKLHDIDTAEDLKYLHYCPNPE